MPDPARELAELRAWLTTAVRMTVREPGPEGLTVLTVPSDGELIAEVRRLRGLADAAERLKACLGGDISICRQACPATESGHVA